MRLGAQGDEYKKSVLDAFEFLLTEENFEKSMSSETQYVCRVDFPRGDMLVRVEYSFKNDTIDILIHRHPETFPLIPMNLEETTSLGILLAYDHRPFSYYENMMPYKAGGIEASLKKLAETFRTCALDIIRGKKWVSVAMVQNPQRRAPGT